MVRVIDRVSELSHSGGKTRAEDGGVDSDPVKGKEYSPFIYLYATDTLNGWMFLPFG